MNTSELVDSLAASEEISKGAAKQLVEAVFEAITTAAALGEEVSIAGFGKFSVKSVAERQGRNPKTGEAMTIAAAKKVSFSPAKALKEKINR